MCIICFTQEKILSTGQEVEIAASEATAMSKWHLFFIIVGRRELIWACS
jgi:hypothetical protein